MIQRMIKEENNEELGVKVCGLFAEKIASDYYAKQRANNPDYSQVDILFDAFYGRIPGIKAGNPLTYLEAKQAEREAKSEKAAKEELYQGPSM